jgi:hypothetical protein
MEKDFTLSVIIFTVCDSQRILWKVSSTRQARISPLEFVLDEEHFDWWGSVMFWKKNRWQIKKKKKNSKYVSYLLEYGRGILQREN